MTSIAFENKYYKLLLLLVLCLFSGGIFTIIGNAFVPLFFDISFSNLEFIYEQPGLSENNKALKFIQFFNGVGLFILPALIYFFLFDRNFLANGLKKCLSLQTIVFVVFIFFCTIPLIGILGKWNEAISLPYFFGEIEAWMIEAEEHAKDLTIAFLQMNHIGDLLINLILIALFPALGEEFIFRGIIQKTINEGSANKHVGIWIAAILFSAIHLQFYGFFPRMFLGALFGYLFLWSGNLWVPVFAHFVNNGFAVLSSYWTNDESIESQLSHTDYEPSALLIISSLITLGVLLMFFKRLNHAKSIDLNLK